MRHIVCAVCLVCSLELKKSSFTRQHEHSHSHRISDPTNATMSGENHSWDFPVIIIDIEQLATVLKHTSTTSQWSRRRPLSVMDYTRPPKIPIVLYHYHWFIFPLHCIAFHLLSCLVLFCCTVHYCLFSFFIFSLLDYKFNKLNLNLNTCSQTSRALWQQFTIHEVLLIKSL